ncbi:MAG: hypothetical protein GY842_22490 [bacterium]|nr:hypothetical protein [bacterium]
MSLHADLLEQARHLLRKEPRRPKQASLRRAVSAAYYAFFHLLVHESSKKLISGATHARLRALTARAFEHGTMKQASRAFASGGLPPGLQPILPHGVPAEIRKLADVFVNLQNARHGADYDVNLKLTRHETRMLVDRVEEAFQLWQTVREDPAIRVYLTALLLWRQWNR